MKESYCSLCLKSVEREDAPILAISGAGVPRYLCDECAADIECATLGRDYDKITEAFDRIAANVSASNVDDPVILSTVTEILDSGAERAKLIAAGEYDFALDEEKSDELEEIPEDMLESEEDKRLDAEEEEKAQRIDKFLNWVWLGVLIGAVGFMIWWFFFR